MDEPLVLSLITFLLEGDGFVCHCGGFLVQREYRFQGIIGDSGLEEI